MTISRPTSPSRDPHRIVLTRWRHKRQKWPLLVCTAFVLCLFVFIIVADPSLSSPIQQINVWRAVIDHEGVTTVVPTPTPFVAQPSPEPVSALPTVWSEQVNLLQAKKRLFYHGNLNLPEVALTFDDGPNPPYTSQILDTLRRYNVKASFFDVGYLAQKYPNLVRQEMAEGHIVGNHTWDHAHLPTLSKSDMAKEINATSDELQQITGTRPMFFRPPYGETDASTLAVINNLGLTTFMWDIMAYDWLMPAPAVISYRVTSVARNGVIILLHDGGGDRTNTVAALPTIIQTLQARGFRFVTLSQLVDHA